MKKVFSILICGLILFGLVGCGDSKSDTASSPESKKVFTAEEYGTELKNAGLAIDNVEVTTAENDKNKLMGRPNGYTSKINFTNGSIEVFVNKEDATNRKEYIDSIGKKMPLVAEYSYINDANTLLRIDKKVVPDDAKKYEEAFMKIK